MEAIDYVFPLNDGSLSVPTYRNSVLIKYTNEPINQVKPTIRLS